MIVKYVILPNRLRKVPKSFSWIDHRFISDGYIDRLHHSSSALYLFLLCAGDEKGLSYYGDQTIMKKLSMDKNIFVKARTELIHAGLIAWQKPMYQVLSLEPVRIQKRDGSGMLLGDILRKAMEETT